MSKKKLVGATSLDVKNAPKQKVNPKLGLIDKPEFVARSFRMTLQASLALDNLTDRISSGLGVRMAAGKVLELCIFNLQHKKLDEILKTD